MVTIKRIDPTSAMRVGALVYAMLFTVMAVLWALFQSLIFSAMGSFANNSSFSVNGVPQAPFNPSSLAAAGLAGCACGYLVGIIGFAIAGGIFGLVLAFSYNLVANWFGGLRVRVEADELPEKSKRELTSAEFEQR